jgi:hypothetical protein
LIWRAQNRSKTQIEAEINVLGELKQDLALNFVPRPGQQRHGRSGGELKSAHNDERDGWLLPPSWHNVHLTASARNAAPPVRQDPPMIYLTSVVANKKRRRR